MEAGTLPKNKKIIGSNAKKLRKLEPQPKQTFLIKKSILFNFLLNPSLRLKLNFLTVYSMLPVELPSLKVDLLIVGGLIPVHMDVFLLQCFLVLAA